MMNENKRKIYVPILKKDLQQLTEEANSLGVAKSNYVFLILFLYKEKQLSINQIKSYKDDIENRKHNDHGFYLNLTPYIADLHANKERGMYSYNQYLATLINEYLKDSQIPRSPNKCKSSRKGMAVPQQIPQRFSEILKKTSIYSKTLIAYTLFAEGFKEEKPKKYTGNNEKIYLQYPEGIINMIPNEKSMEISMLEQVLDKYREI